MVLMVVIIFSISNSSFLPACLTSSFSSSPLPSLPLLPLFPFFFTRQHSSSVTILAQGCYGHDDQMVSFCLYSLIVIVLSNSSNLHIFNDFNYTN